MNSSTQPLPFYKYQGCGNDFALFFARNISAATIGPLVPKLCHRQEGIGADGLFLLEESEKSDCYAHFFNSDGSAGAFCGNGVRCVARYLYEEKGPKDYYTVEMASGLYKATLCKESIEIPLHNDSALEGPYCCPEVPGGILYTLKIGVPHAIIICDSIETIDVFNIGRTLRHHPQFGVQGTNVNFVSRNATGTLKVRTYERGVEGETLACGSGCASAAIAAAYHWKLSSPLEIVTRHGSILHYSFALQGRHPEALTMRGPASRCFQGSIHLPL